MHLLVGRLTSKLTNETARQVVHLGVDVAGNYLLGETADVVTSKVSEVTGGKVKIDPKYITGKPDAASALATLFTTMKGQFNQDVADDLSTPNRLPSKATFQHLGFNAEAVGIFDRYRLMLGNPPKKG